MIYKGGCSSEFLYSTRIPIFEENPRFLLKNCWHAALHIACGRPQAIDLGEASCFLDIISGFVQVWGMGAQPRDMEQKQTKS